MPPRAKAGRFGRLPTAGYGSPSNAIDVGSYFVVLMLPLADSAVYAGIGLQADTLARFLELF
eukprot:7912790-Alexandrium_andersonii.AAC.1